MKPRSMPSIPRTAGPPEFPVSKENNVDIPADIAAMAMALTAYRIEHSAHLPPAVRAQLADTDGKISPVERFVGSMEVLYAAHDELNDAGRTITIQLASFCALHGWPSGNPRSGQIALAMRRELGETPPAGLAWPKPEDDPEPVSISLPVGGQA